MTTDYQVVKIARRIDRHRETILKLIEEIGDSEHPNAQRIREALHEQIAAYAWATHIIGKNLVYQAHWETGDWGIRRKSFKND